MIHILVWSNIVGAISAAKVHNYLPLSHQPATFALKQHQTNAKAACILYIKCITWYESRFSTTFFFTFSFTRIMIFVSRMRTVRALVQFGAKWDLSSRRLSNIITPLRWALIRIRIKQVRKKQWLELRQPLEPIPYISPTKKGSISTSLCPEGILILFGTQYVGHHNVHETEQFQFWTKLEKWKNYPKMWRKSIFSVNRPIFVDVAVKTWFLTTSLFSATEIEIDVDRWTFPQKIAEKW